MRDMQRSDFGARHQPETGRRSRGRTVAIAQVLPASEACWSPWIIAAALVLGLLLLAVRPAASQSALRTEIDVQHYDIEAEISPEEQSLTATAKVRFQMLSDYSTSVRFELNNALSVSRVTDQDGESLDFDRDMKNFTVTVTLAKPIRKGDEVELSFLYGGRLSGVEESPIYGIRFASLKEEFGYLLYPSRWFPLSGYTTDPFEWRIRVTTPAEYNVVSSGDMNEIISDKGMVREFTSSRANFGGSVGYTLNDPSVVSEQGVQSRVFFREEAASGSQAYGQEVGKLVRLLQKFYGLPPLSNLVLFETERGAPNGYAAPGVLFLNTGSIDDGVNSRLLVNQLARQWWGNMIYPESRNHLWIFNGFARYSELLWLEETIDREAAIEDRDSMYIDALTVDYPPALQASRIEDYSPEYWALTASKGAATIEMMRALMGDDAFFKLVKVTVDEFANKALGTGAFSRLASEFANRDMGPFFIQWLESNSAPEFKLEYTVLRTQKGFRVVGKVKQDLDTFSMPVKLLVETEGNPEEQTIEVMGPETEFVVESFGKPTKIRIDPDTNVLRFSRELRVLVAIRRGEQFAEIGQFNDALQEYQKALEVNRNSSLAHYRVAEVFFLQNNYQAAANEFREVLNGDLRPPWTEVWAHINLGKIFDVSGQRERAITAYNAAIRTRDNTAGAQEEAARFLQEPYEREDRF
jgi:aminopeptidase N